MKQFLGVPVPFAVSLTAIPLKRDIVELIKCTVQLLAGGFKILKSARLHKIPGIEDNLIESPRLLLHGFPPAQFSREHAEDVILDALCCRRNAEIVEIREVDLHVIDIDIPGVHLHTALCRGRGRPPAPLHFL